MLVLILSLLLNFQSNVQAQEIVNAKKVLWGKTPGESLLHPLVSTVVVNEVVEFKPLAGHHFNLKANNNCQTQKPKSASEKSVQCQFDQAGKYTASLFICDDANTFCKIEKVSLEVVAPRGYKAALKKRVSSNILYVPKEEISAPPGFIKNKVQFAKDQAKKEDKPLLIAFAAQWCPACNMLNENVFQTKEFQKETESLVKLIVDVDSDISWELKEKFKIGGYPTTVLTTSTLNEIGRFVGYRSPKGLSQWLKTNIALKDEPIEFVQSKIVNLKDSGKDEKFKEEYAKKAQRLAQWYIDQGENEKALNVLLDIKNPEANRTKLIAKLNLAKKGSDKAKTISAIKELLEEYPKDIEFVYWMSDLANQDVDVAKKYLEEMEENLNYWMESPAIETAEYLKAELYYAAADTYEVCGNNNLAQKHYLNCATEYGKLEKLSLLDKPRGAPLERGFCLMSAKQNAEALSLFEKLASQYKKEFAYNFYYARALKENGEKEKALTVVKKSLDGSYGDNFIRASTLKAQIEMALDDNKAAEKTLESAMSKIYLPQTTDIRTHRYVGTLKKILAELQMKKLESEKK